jgi:ABC-2 type transport system ATP-binding protein
MTRERGHRSVAAMDMNEPVISVAGLVKRYGDHEAVSGIDLEVHRGEIFAFLGPNGAGKTTTVEILEGFGERSGGDVRVLGEDPARAGRAWRERIGVVLQESHAAADLTVADTVRLYAGYYGAPRDVEETLALVGLEGAHGLDVGALSGGQRRRLDVALALIGNPELVFLDEPTTGFDPSARRAAWELIGGLRRLGKTVFLTTHYMEEAEALADRIAVIAHGEIVAEGTPASLGGRDRMATAISFTLPAGYGLADLPTGVSALAAAGPDRRVTLRTARPLVNLGELAEWGRDRGVELADLDAHRPTLEDVYLALTEEVAA